MEERKLYFAKINLNSVKIYECYEKKGMLNSILDRIFINIKDGITYEKSNFFKLNDNTEKEYNSSYELAGINKFNGDTTDVLVGGVIKSSSLLVNNIDKEGKDIKKEVEYKEMIKFCFYPRKEIVAFYKRARFGYVEFCEAFQELINESMKNEKNKILFKVTLKREGIDIENIKRKLLKLGSIQSLKIDIMPPNPNSKLLKNMEEDVEEELKEMKEANVTTKSVIFESNSTSGINTKSKIVTNALHEIECVHSKLSVEESISNGYINIKAIDMYGRTHSTQDKNPMKYTIEQIPEGDYDFALICKYWINKILN